jgi:hypothetical protein
VETDVILYQGVGDFKPPVCKDCCSIWEVHAGKGVGFGESIEVVICPNGAFFAATVPSSQSTR